MIGTDVTGNVALPNGTEAVGQPQGYVLAPGVLLYSLQTTIGGTTPGAGNLISGNEYDGIDIVSGGTVAAGTPGDLVEGNLIGTNLAGTQSLPNVEGVGISAGAGFVTIGGSQSGAGNVISGNASYGVFLRELHTGQRRAPGQPDRNRSLPGRRPLPIPRESRSNAPNNTIGGSQAGAGNVISGNTGEGVFLDQGSGNNLLEGNLIGTNAAGTQALANSVGVQISINGNTIGGTQAGERNVISGNTNGGIIDYTSGNLIQGNYIGTDGTGTRPCPTAT